MAARQRLSELGELKVDEVLETEKMYGVDREAANKFITSVDYGKYLKDDREEFDKALTNLEARKKNAMAMIEKDKLDTADTERLAGYFAKGELKEFLDKGIKKNLLEVAKAKVKFAIEEAKNIDEEIEKALKRMTDDQIVEIMNELDYASNDPAVKKEIASLQHQLNNVLGNNPKRLENIATKASGKAHAVLSDLAKAARQKNMASQVAPLETKKQKLEVRIAAATQKRDGLAQQLDQLKNYPTSDDHKQRQRELDSQNGQLGSLQNQGYKIHNPI